ncbi:hypothetical protein M885DRAFT_536981 [Pelagophyceae sp. CCMP2097]|nr:hypothetical protein M885DRAFT_536981 [Pelagophyceae sp. CCMP2097]
MPTDACAATCAACGRAATLRCAGCRARRFCSAACQRGDWKAHRRVCAAAAAAPSERAAADAPQPAAAAAAAQPPARAGVDAIIDASIDDLDRGVADGDARAQLTLGQRCHAGRDTAQSTRRAVDLFRAAADQGLAAAQFELGRCYDKGVGVARDAGAAYAWYGRAATQGDAAALHALGNMFYYSDCDFEADAAEAVRLYALAADLGYAPAQLSLGARFEAGDGVARDVDRAEALYARAAASGNLKATNALRALQEATLA